MSTGAAGAAAAAELARQAEEEMIPYTDKNLAEGWEFKIVRANTQFFRKPEQLRAVLEEERKGGWILVEKFDDSRIRLKRLARAKVVEGDFADGYDPYRTTVGVSQGRLAFILLGTAFGLTALLLLLIAIGR